MIVHNLKMYTYIVKDKNWTKVENQTKVEYKTNVENWTKV